MNVISLNIERFQRKKEHTRKRVIMEKWAVITSLDDIATE